MAINSVHLVSQTGAGARTKAADSAQVPTDSASAKTGAPAEGKNIQDTVKLSGAAQSIQNAERKMANTPDIDQAKVDRLKAAIDSGEYKVNAERTAAGMIDFDNLLG
mgnify:CR=1 FL=1